MKETKPDKVPSAISEIRLDDYCYEGTGTHFNPSFINYFFGNNGTGKTTIGRMIKSGKGITYTGGKTHDDYITLVYNQDFIDSNMRSYHNLKGVFTFNEENGATLAEIDEWTKKQTDAGEAYNKASTEKNNKSTERENLKKAFYTACWDSQKDHRSQFDKTQYGKKKSEPFTTELLRHPPVEHKWDELALLYDSAYSSTARRYQLFNTIADPAELDDVPGSGILGIVIVNVAETGFAAFLKKTGASKWVEEGHAAYHALAGDKCPYCGRKYEAGFDFEQIFKDSFDESYAENISSLNKFYKDYKDKANQLILFLREKPTDIYPAVNTKDFDAKLNELQLLIADNLSQIKKKIDSPKDTVKLQETTSMFQELLDIIAGYNKLIADNNAVVDAGPKKKTECTNKVFEMMHFELDKVITDYQNSDAALSKEIKDLGDLVDEKSKELKTINAELKRLRATGKETETAKTNINRRLKECGFQGFALGDCEPEPRETILPDGTKHVVMITPPNTYAVIRTETGKVAENLSEGEKNFIAFLYFYELVFGNESDEPDTRGKIVVIDDPVSSMDSGALFSVGAYIRRMIEVCHNSYDDRRQIVPGKSIKQIFILTHNAYFHNEVAGLYQNDWYCTTYYLIQKRNMKTTIRPKDHRIPEDPSEWANDNPVKHHYAAKWDEYKELHSNVPLMNVARGILEHYFIQLCGYDGVKLRELILEDPDIKYELTHDENGNEDLSKYDMADKMLSYMSVTGSDINDGIYYVDAMEEDMIRSTFEAIFRYMHQEQHYTMMMGIKSRRD